MQRSDAIRGFSNFGGSCLSCIYIADFSTLDEANTYTAIKIASAVHVIRYDSRKSFFNASREKNLYDAIVNPILRVVAAISAYGHAHRYVSLLLIDSIDRRDIIKTASTSLRCG